ncbi:iron ABC transporter substrate-binding protein, partial [Neisseria meningitidis]
MLNNKHSYSYAKEPHTVKPRFYWAACAVLLTACSPEP